jgi:UDP-N-acetylmuramyl tripeptide synthase
MLQLQPYVVPLGKVVRRLAQLRGGSGSALPGLVAERIDPDFIRRTLSQLPRGVIVVSGTNGKTTTTKMVVDLLESQGLKVFTNRTGSNFTRGVAAALLGEVDRYGTLDADIAVLELDEAHGVRFVDTVSPRYSLLLNVMRDQLDRFGEIDTTAQLLARIAARTTDGIVLNRDDPRLGNVKFIQSLSVPVRTFGTHPSLHALFPSDDNLHSASTSGKTSRTHPTLSDDVSLEKLSGHTAQISYGGKKETVELKINGIYNVLNAVAAVALCRTIMGSELNDQKMLARLQTITPAFGRGETFTIHDQPLELVLVKNPGGFRLSLASFPPKGYKSMIAINDNYADGRDMSWLWDVDFESLRDDGVAMVSGMRAYDMALRLQYDEVPVSQVEPNLSRAVRQFIAENSQAPKHIFCTYTAMMHIRRELAKITDVERVK